MIDLQRGEQTLRAVTDVLMLAPGRLAWRGRRVGLGRRFGLDLGLLIERDHQHVPWRIHIQTAHLATALLKLRTSEVTHDPVVGQVRRDLRPRQDHMRLGARHPDLPAELLIRPPLPPGALQCLRRPGARLRDQQRPRQRPMRQRRPGPRRVAQPRDPITRIASAPLRDRRLRTPHQLADLQRPQPLGGQQHDPGPLDHP